MKFSIGLFLILFTSLGAWAQTAGLQGKWIGWGEWTFDGSGTNCQMQMAFSESATELKRTGGYFDCNVVGLASDPKTWVIQGSDLLEDGAVVGHIKNNFVQVSEAYSDTVHIVTTMKLNGSKMDYEEIWYIHGTEVLYRIIGEFRKN